MRFQVDELNLTNVLDVIDFGRLFSGNAIGPPRKFGLRLTTSSSERELHRSQCGPFRSSVFVYPSELGAPAASLLTSFDLSRASRFDYEGC